MRAFRGGFGQRATAAVALSALLMTGMGGCKSQEDADAAAEQMTKTAAMLSAYYDALDKIVAADEDTFVAQDALDISAGLEKTGTAAEILPSLEETRKQLKVRKAMADDIVKIAATFSQVDKSTAAKDTSAAAGKLDSALVGAGALKAGGPSSSAIAQGVQDLLLLVQAGAEEKAAKKVAPLADSLMTFFDSERDAYDSLNATYLAAAKTVSETLVDRNQVDPAKVFASALEPFGLTPVIDRAKLRGGMQEYEKRKIADGYETKLKSGKTATDCMSDALKEMHKRLDAVASGRPMRLRTDPASLKTVAIWVAGELKEAL